MESKEEQLREKREGCSLDSDIVSVLVHHPVYHLVHHLVHQEEPTSQVVVCRFHSCSSFLLMVYYDSVFVAAAKGG